MFSKFLFHFNDNSSENLLQGTLFYSFRFLYISLMRKNFDSSESILSVFVESGHGKHVERLLHNHSGPFDMQQNNGMKFSRDLRNYIDFQLDVHGEGTRGILNAS